MESGSSLSPNMSAIIVAIIQIFGSTASAFAIGSMSRKLLYALTCCGTMVGLLAMGLHGYLKTFVDTSNFDWVPIVSLSFVIFVASIGILPLTFVMLSEILPQKVSLLKLMFYDKLICRCFSTDSKLWYFILHRSSMGDFISTREIFFSTCTSSSTVRLHVYFLWLYLVRNDFCNFFRSGNKKQKQRTGGKNVVLDYFFMLLFLL